MVSVLRSAWALLFGMLLLMVGNGLQGTLLGVRGAIEGFSTLEMSVIMSAYFVGFLGGSRLAPEMIRRVGHIRVFAALCSMISAVLILYPLIAHPVSWTVFRVVIGFCFSGVYVTAESWLNNATTSENRGRALSLYMITQMAGVPAAQGLLVLGDPAGFALFVVLSVLVSISFTPILLSVTPVPAFETTRPMTLRELIAVSPLGCVGMFLTGGMYSAQFGMASVYGTQAGLSLPQISIFIAAIYLGGLLLQYPIGWLSDRIDRRILITAAGLGGTAASFLALIGGAEAFWLLCVGAFFVGGSTNPLYALLIAYTNDFLEYDQMAAAGGGMVFLNGIGAIVGPLIVGVAMTQIGPAGFFLYLAVLLAALSGYALYRMTRRPATPVEDAVTYAPVLPSSTPVAVEVAQEVFIEAAQEEAADAPGLEEPAPSGPAPEREETPERAA